MVTLSSAATVAILAPKALYVGISNKFNIKFTMAPKITDMVYVC